MQNLTKKLKVFIWQLRTGFLRNYSTSKSLDALIYKSIWLLDNCENVSVSIDYYNITIRTSSSKIIFWNANKFYGWLSNGSVNGVGFKNLGASAEAMYDFIKCLKKHGHSIYISEPTGIDYIPLNEVKC